MRGNILRMLLIIFLVVSTMTVVSVSTASPGPAVISVEPPTSTAGVGETFTVDINITDVSNLYFWEFRMSFNDPKTDTWTGDNVTKSFVTTGKPVLYETQEIYVNHALMPEVMNETDTWTGDNVTKTFDTTIKPIVEYSETVIANFTDTWTGNGLTTTFLTTKKPIVEDSEKVYVNQILMTKPADYNVSNYEGGFIVFTTAPGDGAEIEATYRATAKKEEHYKIDYVAGTVMFIETPENGAIIEATYRYTQYTIEYSTGIITFKTAPGLEAEIEAIYLIPPIIEVVDVMEGPFLSDVDSTSWSILPPYIDNTTGIVKASNLLWHWPGEGASGNGTLCTITFQVKDVGNTTIHFYYTLLQTYGEVEIEHTTEDGYFSNIHDVAITEVIASPNSVAVGESVSINLTVANKGDFPETFDVTTHWNIGALHGVIGTNVTSLDGRNSTLLRLTWPTTGICTGTYTISAEASVVLGENWIEDNALIDGEVTVNATGQPEANLIYSPTEPKVGENITFTSTSTDPDGTIVSWDWTFDDESIGSGEVVTHVYAETGTYKVTLNVTDDEGLCNIVWKPVTVLDYPVASFTYSPEEPLRNRTVTFDASGSTPDGGTIDSYAWDFGDGTTETYFGVNLTAIAYHTYEQEGTYTVNLTVTNSGMLTDSFTDTLDVKIKHDAAVSSISYDYSGKPSIKIYADYTTIEIDIVARNEGTETETFNVTAYLDGTSIETQEVAELAPLSEKPLDRIYLKTTGLSAGEYNITAMVILIGDENSTNNNATITIDVHVADLAITNVIVSPTTVLAGDLLNVSVTVKNEGTVAPSIAPRVYIYFSNATHSDMSIVDFSIVVASGAEKTKWWTWNATKAAISSGTYILSAKIEPIEVAGDTIESDLEDNTYLYGNVTVGASLVSISANPETITVGSSTTINGTITPVRSSVNVMVQYRLSGNETWNTLETVTTNENGTYSYDWKPETAGTYEVKASWEGDDDTLPGESETLTITVNQIQPNVFLYVLAAVAIIAIAATAIYLLKFRKPKLK